jgi:hypothetical protein
MFEISRQPDNGPLPKVQLKFPKRATSRLVAILDTASCKNIRQALTKDEVAQGTQTVKRLAPSFRPCAAQIIRPLIEIEARKRSLASKLVRSNARLTSASR